MKKVVYILTASILFFACKKTDLANPESQNLSRVESLLKDSLSVQDYNRLDFTSVQQSQLKDHSTLFRLNFKVQDSASEFIVVKVDAVGKITNGKIVKLAGSLDTIGTKTSYNGDITMQNLHRQELMSSRISNGYIQAYHTLKVSSNSIGGYSIAVNSECADCTLPDVIVSSSINAGSGISWGAWMSLLAMFDGGGGYSNDYFLIDSGGGGGSYSGDVITVDFEAPESKNPIDAKKYIDCFGTIPDNNATCTITIASDIPVDGHPEKFFNWSEASPGHTYIELYKAGSSGGIISQNIGFYPNTAWKTVGGGDIGSKLADDAGHEYNARYTISVTPAQLQAALNMVQTLSTHDYNISSYNCTDFALAVFNAGGGNLTIPKYQIPGYANGTTGSNTPQGLYNQLNDMGGAGNAGVNIVGSKGYGSISHGPCN